MEKSKAAPRRSMGTRPSRGVARISTESEVPSSSSRPSTALSRIPRTSMAKPSRIPQNTMASSSKRSSSVGSRSSLAMVGGMPMVTPRSSSAHRTPQRPLQANNNVLNGAVNSMRFSNGSARGSFIGAKAVKDGRPLNEKEWQKQAVQKILEFLSEAGYPRSLTASNFPLNATEYRNVLEFTLNMFCPGVEVGKRMEQELPQLLKKIGYPTQVSKATFQTLGTSHSWPSALGVIHYMVERARNQMVLEMNVERIVFENRDEMGFAQEGESDDQTQFRHFVNCYAAFNQGRDDYDAELQQLEEELMENHGVDVQLLQKLQKEVSASRRDVAELSKVSNGCAEKEKLVQGLKADRDTFRRYLDQQLEYNKKKKEEMKATYDHIEGLRLRKEGLKKTIAELDAACRAKGMDPTSTSLDFELQSLQQELDRLKAYIKEKEKNIWTLQQNLGKVLERQELILRKYNSEILSLDLDFAWQEKLRLDGSHQSGDVDEVLRNLMREKLEEEFSVQQKLENIQSILSKMEREDAAQEEEKSRLEKELVKRKDELEATEKKISSEDSELSREIERLRTTIHDLKRQQDQHSNLAQLEAKAVAAEAKLKEKEEERKAALAEGIAFLKGAYDMVDAHVKKQMARRDAFRDQYIATALEVMEEARNVIEEVRQRADLLQAEAENALKF